jgi:tRNA A-37 threonylcarbamoyl transferase component Bud32
MSDRWDRVGRLFEQAVAAPPDARAALIDESPESDEIKEEVRSLVASHQDAGGFLEGAVVAPSLTSDDLSDNDAPLPTLTPGSAIGPYRIERLIGQGGMGVVYEATDTRLHRRVAVKSLSPELAREPRQRERLKQEARAAAALTHPNIATVYALEDLDGHLFIVSEYLDGQTLRVELEQQPTSAAYAVGSGLEIARALCAAHERGIVHRDLKPENIVRTTAGTLKVLDFGLARFTDPAGDLVSRTRLTQTGMVAGTPPYMAPEQLLGGDTDFRTDHFAFGVLLYEMATGRHPFEGRTMPSVIAQILAAPPQAPRPADEMPIGLWRIVSRCLEKEPAARYASTIELVDALEAERQAVPGVGRRSTSVHPQGRAVQGALSWWRFHQAAAALAYWSMVWPAWHVHALMGRVGLPFFFALLAAVVVAGNLRLHLWFSSSVYPEDLERQRADVSRWVLGADIAFALLLIAAGIALPPERAGWAAVLISFGIGSALAFLFIEPATARAAFREDCPDAERRTPR